MKNLPEEFRWLEENGCGDVPSRFRCHCCFQKLDASGLDVFSKIRCPGCGAELTVPVNFAGFHLYKLLHISRNARIYLARNAILERDVALKIPVNPEMSEYYRESFETLARHAHPGVLWIYNSSVCGNFCCGALQLMKLGNCRGATELRRRFGSSGLIGRLTPVAEALKMFARRGITHRDICPGNLLCAESGEIRLANIHPGGEDAWPNSPRHWRYQSPESLRDMEFSSAADLYSFSATTYEMLCGAHPFRSPETPDALMDAMMKQTPVPVSKLNPQVPPVLSELLAAGLDIEPANRPGPDEVVKAFRLALNDIMEREFE